MTIPKLFFPPAYSVFFQYVDQKQMEKEKDVNFQCSVWLISNT